MAKKTIGRPRLTRSTTQKRLNLAYMDLLEPLRSKLTPLGVELSDSQLIDTCVATVHGLLVEKGVEVVDPDRMMALLNEHFSVIDNRDFEDKLLAKLEPYLTGRAEEEKRALVSHCVAAASQVSEYDAEDQLRATTPEGKPS